MDLARSLKRRDYSYNNGAAASITIGKRIPDSTTSTPATTSSCESNASGNTCEKSSSISSALPIALGVCVPVIALVVFFFLHRQYRKRLRVEDQKDAEKYKSMDFGMDINYNSKGKKGKGKKGQNMTSTDNRPVHMRGLSLEPTSNPFFLPNGPSVKTFYDNDLDSIHEDRYQGMLDAQRANSIRNGNGSIYAGSIRAASATPSRSHSPMAPRRAQTMETSSTISHNYRHDAEANLLYNVQANPISHPPRSESVDRSVFQEADKFPAAPAPAVTKPEGRDSYFEKNAHNVRRSNNYLESFFGNNNTGNNSSNNEDHLWGHEQEKPSPPSSHVESTGSTYMDSSSTRGTKTPLTSFSDTDSLPPMPHKTSELSPTEHNGFAFDLTNHAELRTASPEPSSSASGRKPLRLGMPVSGGSADALPQPSVEYRVAPTSETLRHQSFGASVHMSVVSADTSNFSDILNTPRDSIDPPPLPDMHAGLQRSNPTSPLQASFSPESYEPQSRSNIGNDGLEYETHLRPNAFAPVRKHSLAPLNVDIDHGFNFALDGPPAVQGSIPPRGESLQANTPKDEEFPIEHDDPLREFDVNATSRMSVLVRPLPPDEELENPEERANRIRSFYKEYFDENSALTSQVPLPPGQQGEYMEDYGSEYQDAGTLYDPRNKGFVVAAPYAQPVTRRAMTPPPRAPPRFDSGNRSRSGSGKFLAPPRGQSSMGQQQRRGRSPSSPHHLPPPRGAMSPYSSRGPSAMSNYSRTPSAMSGSSRRPTAPLKNLNSLPTPSKLANDTAIFDAADFAPPLTFRDRQQGRRPESPLGAQRPYSPSVRAFVPLGNSFEDLNVIPSP
jgi:hypothetical protein